MDFETLKVVVDGAVARLTLSRPGRLNALGATMLRELAEAAAWLDEQHAVRAVVICGEGRAFSAGADLKDPPLGGAALSGGGGWSDRRRVGKLGQGMTDAIEGMRAITIAAVHGHVVGGGVVLALACDMRIAADDARLRIPEIELGLPLTWGAIPRLVAELGPSVTKDWVITCREVGAEEARAAGFWMRVVPRDALLSEAEALATRVAEMPEVPVTMTKEHVNAVARQSTAQGLDFAEGDRLLAASLDPDSRAAMARYVERNLGGKRTTKTSDASES